MHAEELNIEQCAEAVNPVLNFSSSGITGKTDDAMKTIADAIDTEDNLKTSIMLDLLIKRIILILIIIFSLVSLNFLIIILVNPLFFST